MLPTLAQVLDQRLSTEGSGRLGRTRFAELVARLLAGGVLWRDWSRSEAALYDDAGECEELLREWFGAVGFYLAHDADARIFRLHPPGERAEVDGDADVGRQLRARLSRDFVAAVIALRFLYTEALTGRRALLDERLPISLEELSQAVVSLLGHQLPTSATDRLGLLRELRRHRVIQYEGDDASSMEMGLAVLRPVMSFVSDEALDDALRVAGLRHPPAPAAEDAAA
ncbi:DUF4194 domain-containing protein [Derxia lacustris]|uniref:DUF4194 domain-containing protein n=1 Tax=Derxia lacustris TaxID=764842 RepID=UPI000A177F6B|nr:DUF4194 domain-containing protein [Derxia lacustris]